MVRYKVRCKYCGDFFNALDGITKHNPLSCPLLASDGEERAKREREWERGRQVGLKNGDFDTQNASLSFWAGYGRGLSERQSILGSDALYNKDPLPDYFEEEEDHHSEEEIDNRGLA